MKNILKMLTLLTVILLTINACKKEHEENMTAVNTMIDAMSWMSVANDSMLHGDHNHLPHHDSIYHHHDSVYWHHHDEYHHGDTTHHHDDWHHDEDDHDHHDSLHTVHHNIPH